MSVKILGISCYYHDSAAALVVDGEIDSAVQEERFTRKKHDSNFPINSIKFILKKNNISLNEIDYIVFYEKPFLKFERLLETYLDNAPFGLKSFLKSMPIWSKEKLFQKQNIFKELNNIDKNFKDKSKLKFVEHHVSHAASAYYPSPFNNAIIFTADGVGEWATTTIGIGKENKIDLLKEIIYPDSLGLLYSAFTYYCGFKVNDGEYKLMGLAPYGKPIYKDLIYDNLITVYQDGTFKLNQKFFDYSTGLTMVNSNFENLFGRKVKKIDEKIDQFYMNVAASIQLVLEEIILKICKNIKAKYKISNLCLAGGVALNCVINGKIEKEKIFENIWIQPAAGDAGGALGSALYLWNNLESNEDNKINKPNIDTMKGSYLGPSYNNDEVKAVLDQINAKYEYMEEENLIDFVAKQISEEKIFGWFQGKMEFGPRALGNRSIIADPTSSLMQKNLNLKIKFRESFRPFAPAILEEEVQNWFKLDCKSPYMLMVSEVLNDKRIKLSLTEENLDGIEKLRVKRSIIPAITHVDYSARIQTVNKKDNNLFYKLINKFYEIKNVPILVNTSFNVKDEPIVNTIEDAYRCFLITDLDFLVCGNYVLEKKNQY
jgi:carbamoyltransferase